MTKKIVVAGIAGAALAAGTAAYAYPPGTSMTAEPKTAPAAGKGTTVTVHVTNSNPQCAIRFDVNDAQYTQPAGHPTNFQSPPLAIKSERGTHVVHVKTVGCGGD